MAPAPRLVVAEAVSMRGVCPRCSASATRLYRLPEKALLSQAAPHAACYFCYARLAGMKPTRRQAVA